MGVTGLAKQTGQRAVIHERGHRLRGKHGNRSGQVRARQGSQHLFVKGDFRHGKFAESGDTDLNRLEPGSLSELQWSQSSPGPTSGQFLQPRFGNNSHFLGKPLAKNHQA